MIIDVFTFFFGVQIYDVLYSLVNDFERTFKSKAVTKVCTQRSNWNQEVCTFKSDLRLGIDYHSTSRAAKSS